MAKQFKRANRALKTIRTYLGRVTRDIVRKIRDDAELESVFAHPLMLGRQVREQRQHQRGRKIYSLHAPEVECIGKSLPSGLTRGARRIALTNSASRCRSPPRSIAPRAASSSPTPRRCPATLTTATPSPP
jgi:IS5 family transposase